MRQDSRFSRVLHALLHLENVEGPVTSDHIAHRLGTNPAVVRRTLAGLRDAGILISVKGHGGGWSLAKSLADTTLYDVYAALGSPPLFAIGNDENDPSCNLEGVANAAVTEVLALAHAEFIRALHARTVASLIDSNEGLDDTQPATADNLIKLNSGG